MKKIIILIAIFTFSLFSCSKDSSSDCQEITTLRAWKNPSGVYEYKISYGDQKDIVTNEATVRYYQRTGIRCFEGFKQ